MEIIWDAKSFVGRVRTKTFTLLDDRGGMGGVRLQSIDSRTKGNLLQAFESTGSNHFENIATRNGYFSIVARSNLILLEIIKEIETIATPRR